MTVVGLPLLTASASASTVSVQETPGDTNQVLLTYQAGAGEDNHLTITPGGKSNGHWELYVLDPGAAITPAAGCSGGGTEATCTIHEPKGFDYGTCTGHDCIPPTIPGTAWKVHWTVALGGGDNYFDGSAFPGTYSSSIAMAVSSGAGDDRISTGGGEDTIDPGPGSDQVRGGDGFDRVETTAFADGPDLYEEVGEVSYQNRSEPIRLEGGTAGAAGENDKLVEVIEVAGGSAGDWLIGGPGYNRLKGGSGDDTLEGGAGDDDLYGGPGNDLLSGGEGFNHLVGEEGDDVYNGGAGNDIIRESEPHQEFGSDASLPSPEGGDDIAYGEGGNDAIDLGVGSDRAFGGPGDDDLDGGAGSDFLKGGAGADGFVGGKGFDRISGGAGSDLIFSGRWHWPLPKRKFFPFRAEKDDGPDLVDCGRGHDVAVANPWDRLHRCEVVRLVRPPGKSRG